MFVKGADFVLFLTFFEWMFDLFRECGIDHGQATGKLYHMWLQVECTLFVIYKAGREPTPYW
jgi:hypothetical protein